MRKIKTTGKFKVLLWMLISCFTLVAHGYAQNPQTGTRKITGKITDKASGEPVAGVTVSVRNSKNSVSTDKDGVFAINATTGATLTISGIGYSKTDIKVGDASQVDLALNKEFNKLDEVVVIGYGTAKKRDLVGAVDIVAAKDAGSTASTNPSQLLIGKSAGVQIVQSSGTPGADAQILIRGTGSFTNVDPLYIVDGIQGSKNVFNSLNAQDIENITILKDASSTAIYGSAAANGVVIITTRKGKNGPAKVSFNSQWGVAKAWKQLDLLNASQYVDLLKDFAATSNTALPAKFSTSSVLVDSNNWQKQIFRTAMVSENDINITGGSEKTTYNLSLGYISQESTLKGYTNNRLNTRFSLDETLGRFHLGQSLGIRYTNTKGETNTNGQLVNITDGIEYAPYKPVHDPTVPGGYSIVSNIADFSNVNNPLQAVNLMHPVNTEFVFFPQAFGEVSLIKGLKFRSQFAAEIGGGKYTSYQYPYTASNNLAQPRQAVLGYNSYSSYILENYFSYNRTFGQHTIAATIGNSYQDPGSKSGTTVTGSNIPNDNIQNISVAQTQTVTGSYVDYEQAAVISYYGRLIYSFDNKYSLSGSYRRDGASNFGANNRFGNFYGAGFAWKFIDENFLKSQTFLSDGKLRIGWGSTGNNHIPTTGITSVLTFSGTPSGNLVYSLGSNEAFNAGTTIATLANPDIKWESTKQTDIGIDLGFLNNKLNLTVDWYDRKSSGLLVQVPVAASTGASLSGAQPVEFANAASAENKGIEVTIGYHNNISKDLTFNVNGNVGYNKNKVLSLGSKFTAPIQDGAFQNLSTFTYTAPGSAVGAFYGYKVDHIAKNQAEIDALNAKAPGGVYQAGLKPGDFIYKDLNGNGTVTDSDQVILGNPIPKFVYGFSAGLNYKNFDLNLVFSGVAGLKLLNGLKFFTSTEATGHNTTTSMLGRWRQPGDVASLPRAGQDATSSGNLRPSDWWLENGDYLRLRNLTIGYTLPKEIVSGIGNGHVFTRIRLYIAAQNLLTITKYSGYDPELSTQSGLNTTTHPSYVFTRGIDDGAVPQPRTFLGGLQIGF